MNLTLTIVLVAGALIVFLGIVWKIRKAELSVASSVFWFLFSISLLLLAFFPQIAYFFSYLFNIESPANFVFLYVIAVLLIRSFMDTIQITKLHAKLNDLVQEQALSEECPADPASDVRDGTAK